MKCVSEVNGTAKLGYCTAELLYFLMLFIGAVFIQFYTFKCCPPHNIKM